MKLFALFLIAVSFSALANNSTKIDAGSIEWNTEVKSGKGEVSVYRQRVQLSLSGLNEEERQVMLGISFTIGVGAVAHKAPLSQPQNATQEESQLHMLEHVKALLAEELKTKAVEVADSTLLFTSVICTDSNRLFAKKKRSCSATFTSTQTLTFK
jgi:hypothetical protein